jgi:hypothetical protein
MWAAEYGPGDAILSWVACGFSRKDARGARMAVQTQRQRILPETQESELAHHEKPVRTRFVRSNAEAAAPSGMSFLSRPGPLARLPGMSAQRRSTTSWIAAIVIAHLIISLIHGLAHAQAQVPMSLGGNIFVFGVILAGPLVGLLLLSRAKRVGIAVVATTLTASCIFGVVNHFLLAGPDHVAHIAEQARPMFAATAVLLMLTETAGAILSIRLMREGMVA